MTKEVFCIYKQVEVFVKRKPPKCASLRGLGGVLS